MLDFAAPTTDTLYTRTPRYIVDEGHSPLIPMYDSTNSNALNTVLSRGSPDVCVDATMTHAITHYDALLRKLAD